MLVTIMSVTGASTYPDPVLSKVLACPSCKAAPLRFEPREVICTNPSCQLHYPVRDGIPVLLPSEARTIDPDAATLPPEAR